MNKSRVNWILKGAAASALALGLSAQVRADDRLLSVNGVTLIQPARLTSGGVIPNTNPLIITGFDVVTAPRQARFGLGQGSLTMIRAKVKMCKPGTGGRLEWLDQGLTVVAVTGTLTSASIPASPPNPAIPTGTYRLVFTNTDVVDTYAASTGPCALVPGKEKYTITYTSTRGAALEKKTTVGGVVTWNNINPATTTYNLWNVTNGVPEPATLLLILSGLLGYGWMTRRRARSI
jgi:hypothetical protein